VIEAQGQQLEALKIIFAAKAIGLEMNWWVDERGEMIRQTIPSMMNLLLEKVTEEEAMAFLPPLEIADHIAVAQRMGSAKRLTFVHLTGDSDGIPAAELVPNGPLQKVVATGPRTAQIVVKAETDEGLAGISFPFSGPHLAEYLAPTDIIQSGDPAIIAKARGIIGDEGDAWAAAQKLTNWVYNNMGKVDHDPQPYTAIECLTLMKGDCSEHSTLLCALSRAVGIPSKFVTGLIYMDNGQSRGYFYHAWNELYVGRWVSVDATWGETTSNAGHLTLASGSLTSESFAQTNLSAVRSMGVLKLEVAEFKTK
jgi:transglutaminase-like putative cysteine protease